MRAEAIFPHTERYDGHFTYRFQEGLFFLGKVSVSKSEALTCLGVMPHNNILTNKVMNALGERILAILRKQDADRPRVSDRFICQTVADEAELLGNWAMVLILSTIRPLEKLIGVDAQSNEKNSIMGEVQDQLLVQSGVRSKDLVSKILKNYFRDNLGSNEFSEELDKKLISIFDTAYEQLQKLQEENLSPTQFENYHRDLLRTIMNRFEELQADISIAQRGVTNLFSIANGTNTSATQKAYYAIQNHTYSAAGCTDDQLWLPQKQKSEHAASAAVIQLELDTAKYAGIRQDDALFVASLLERVDSDGILKAENVAAALAYDRESKKTIKIQHTALKKQIDKARGGVFGALGIFRDSAISQARTPELTEKGGWILWNRFKNYVFGLTPQQKIEIQNTLNEFDREENSSSQTPAQDVFNTSINPAYVYKPGDLLSAIASFSYEFGEYFSREMAAKHPSVTTVGFIIPATCLLTIAMANLGVAPHFMAAIYKTMGEVLSGDGHVVAPNKISQTFKTIDEAWLWVTKCHGIAETVMMTAFGGPKILYLITEQLNAILSKTPETTWKAMERYFNTGQLNVNLPSDVVREKLKSVLAAVMMFGFSAGLGMVTAMLPKARAGVAVLQQVVDMFDNIQANTFTAIATQNAGLIVEAGAVLQLLAEVKTAGLFLGKIIGVAHFLRQGYEAEDLAAINYFQSLRNKKLSDTEETIKNSNVFEQQKAVLESNLAKKPENKVLLFGETPQASLDFLNACGIRELKRSPWPIRAVTATFKLVGRSLLTLITGIPGALYYAYRAMRYSGDQSVPNTTTGLYFYKNGAKLMLNTLKFGMTAWYGVKFFGQALGGFVSRVASGLYEAGKNIITTPLKLIRRIRSENGLAFQYILAQGAKILTIGTGLLELTGKAAIVALSPALSVGVIIGSLINAAIHRNGVGKNLWEGFSAIFITPWKVLSHPGEKLKDYIVRFDQKDKNQGGPSISASHWFIRIKNKIGSFLSVLRDNTMRRLEHNLQTVAYHENQLRQKAVQALLRKQGVISAEETRRTETNTTNSLSSIHGSLSDHTPQQGDISAEEKETRTEINTTNSPSDHTPRGYNLNQYNSFFENKTNQNNTTISSDSSPPHLQK